MGSVAVTFTAASVRFRLVIDEQPISVSEWLTVPQVAERLNIRITRVHRLIREGEL
ncbi:MAG: hypothetical protein ACRDTD_23655, partial [Pseudonocardiaceae bacterium]